MKVELHDDCTLFIKSENITEAWALKFWVERNKITNVNGVDMIPSRSIIFSTPDASSAAVESSQPEKPHG